MVEFTLESLGGFFRILCRRGSALHSLGDSPANGHVAGRGERSRWAEYAKNLANNRAPAGWLG